MIPCPICGTRTGIHGFSWEHDRRVREAKEEIASPPADDKPVWWCGYDC